MEGGRRAAEAAVASQSPHLISLTAAGAVADTPHGPTLEPPQGEEEEEAQVLLDVEREREGGRERWCVGEAACPS